MSKNVKRTTPQRFRVRYRNRLILAFVMMLSASVLAQHFLVPYPHEYFPVASTYWFYPAVGLLASMVMVLAARLLGVFLKFRDTFWEERL